MKKKQNFSDNPILAFTQVDLKFVFSSIFSESKFVSFLLLVMKSSIIYTLTQASDIT